MNGETTPGLYNLMFVADKGHSPDEAVGNICTGIRTTFNSTAYDSICHQEISTLIRKRRGLAYQHDASFMGAVQLMEEKLANGGVFAHQFDNNVFAKPFRADFLLKLARANPIPNVYCETGMGAGHSSLLMLNELPHVRVHSFDSGTSAFSVAVHDYLDEKFPERIFLYLGESAQTVPRMFDFFPSAPCDVVYIDGSPSYEAVRADLMNFRRLVQATPNNVVVLPNAADGTDALRAWTDLVSEGFIRWDGTVYESPSLASSDALVYGTYVGIEALKPVV